MFPFQQTPHSFCLYYSKFLFAHNCWNRQKYTYWALTLLSGPLTEPQPITNQNQDTTKQNMMVKKLSNSQPIASFISRTIWYINTLKKKKKKTQRILGNSLGVHYKGRIPHTPSQGSRRNRNEKWGILRKRCASANGSSLLPSFCLDRLTIAIMSKRRRVFSQNGLSLATLSSIWHKSRNTVLTILTQVLNRVLTWENPFKTSITIHKKYIDMIPG